MLWLMLRSALVALFLLALFGCDYTTTRDVDGTATRLVENDGACPPADSIENGFISDADRTAWHRIDMPPLCFYELPADEGFGGCPRGHKLEDVSTDPDLKKALAPSAVTGEVTSASTYRCTSDHGAVLVTQGTPDCTAMADGGTLVLQVERTPYRWCKYETTEEHTERPFSCGGGGGVFAPE